MAMKKIGAKIVLEGEAEYRSAMKQINAEQKELRSELKLVASEFEGQENSIEAITAKNEVLNKQIETQNKKLEEYNKMLEAAQTAQNDQADEIERLNQALADASEEYEKMVASGTASTEELENQKEVMASLEGELDQATARYDDLAQVTSKWQTNVNLAQADLNNLKNEMSQTTEETSRFGDVLSANLASDAIMSGLEKLVDLMKEAGNELIEMGTSAAYYADEINTLSTQTGIATDTIQTFKYAEELMDVSLSTATNAMRKNIQSMDKARSGTESYVEAYRKLGVEVTDSNGQLRDAETVFWECVDALGKMSNNAEKDATSMTLFGRSAQQLNPLIKTGSEGFRKYGEEAKKLGYILDSDTLNGLNKTSDALERASKMTDAIKMKIGAQLAPEIEDSVQLITKAVEENEAELSNLCEGAIKALTSALEFIINNADSILTFMGAMASAFVAWETYSAIITVVNSSMSLYKAVTEGATIAQLALNVAMDANPVGLLVAGIGALIGGLTTYAALSGTSASNTKSLSNEVKSLGEEISKNKIAYDEEVASIERNGVVATELADKIKKLNGTTDPKKQNELRLAIEQLNSIYPELSLSIDENTGKVEGNTDALETNLKALENKLLLSKKQEEINAIVEKSVELEEKKKEAEEGLKRTQEELIQLNKEYEEGLKASNVDIVDLEQQIKDAELAQDGYKTALEEVNPLIKEQEDAFNNLVGEVNELASANEEATSATENYNEATFTTINGVTTLKNATDEQVSAVKNLADAYNDAQTEARASLDAQVGLFDEISNKSDKTTGQMKTNLEGQAKVMNTMADDLNTLQGKFDSLDLSTDLLSQLASLGVDGAGYIHELATASDAELKSVVESFENVSKAKDELSGELAVWSEEVQNAIGSLAETADGNSVGETIIDDVVKGITGGADDIKKASENVVKDAKKTMIDASKDLNEAGQKVDENTADGIKEDADKVTDAVKKVGEETLKTAKTEFGSDEFKEVGEDVCKTIAKGVENGSGAVSEAVKKVVKAALNAAKEEAKKNGGDDDKKDGENQDGDGDGGNQDQDGNEDNGNQSIGSLMNTLNAWSMSEVNNSTGRATRRDENEELAQMIADSISDNVQIRATFAVEGDTNNIFRVVRKEASTYRRSTGRSAF